MFRNLAYNENYVKNLKNHYILLDTSYLLDLSHMKNDDLIMFLDVLRGNGCVIATIMDVFQEFVRGAKDEKEYNSFIDLFNKGLHIQTIRQESVGEEAGKFVVAYNKLASKKASLTDLKLAITLFEGYKNNRKIKLLSANYNDLPLALLKRENMIVYDKRGEVRTHAFYGIADKEILETSLSKYSKNI